MEAGVGSGRSAKRLTSVTYTTGWQTTDRTTGTHWQAEIHWDITNPKISTLPTTRLFPNNQPSRSNQLFLTPLLSSYSSTSIATKEIVSVARSEGLNYSLTFIRHCQFVNEQLCRYFGQKYTSPSLRHWPPIVPSLLLPLPSMGPVCYFGLITQTNPFHLYPWLLGLSMHKPPYLSPYMPTRGIPEYTCLSGEQCVLSIMLLLLVFGTC